MVKRLEEERNKLKQLAEDNHAKAMAALKDMKAAQEALAKNVAEMKGYEERIKNELLGQYKKRIQELESKNAELQHHLDKTTLEFNFMKQ